MSPQVLASSLVKCMVQGSAQEGHWGQGWCQACMLQDMLPVQAAQPSRHEGMAAVVGQSGSPPAVPPAMKSLRKVCCPSVGMLTHCCWPWLSVTIARQPGQLGSSVRPLSSYICSQNLAGDAAARADISADS